MSAAHLGRAASLVAKRPKTTATVAAAAALLMAWEGLRTTAYPDIIGVWTICYGHTHGVRPGQKATVAECDEKLFAEVQQVDAALTRCGIPATPIGPRVAALSLAYNVGAPTFCKSTMARLMREGAGAGACPELRRWVFAGGKRVQGLVNRREDEYKVCMLPNSAFNFG